VVEPLYMYWPADRPAPSTPIASGYALRPFRPGDEGAHIALLASADLGNWDLARLKQHILSDPLSPDGIFFVTRDGVPVGCASVHDRTPPRARKRVGELGWLAVHPDHRGCALGAAVCAAAIQHLLARGFEFIRLQVDESRPAAVKTFLKLGFLPVLRNAPVRARWQALWAKLDWDQCDAAPLRKVTRDVTTCAHSRFNAPTLSVSCGETFLAETELCSGDWLTSIDDRWRPGIGFGPNPTVVVEIDGAQPGDVLAVQVDAVQPDELGYTGFGPGVTPFPDWIRHVEWGVVTRTVRIRDGFVEWSDDLKLPIQPMIGTLGTAPAIEVFSNAWPGQHGGNMDAQEVRPGATVYLPVSVPGALLHIGDVHAIQGDGEICCGGGIECRSEVTLTVGLAPGPERMAWPRIVDDTHLTAVGCARPAEDAFRIATEQLIYWLADSYDMDERDAFLLLGQVLEARCTQFVDPLYTYVAKIQRGYLLRGVNAAPVE